MLLFGASHTAVAAPPPSSVNLNVEASAANLAAIINRSLPGQLYKGEAGLGITVTVLRTAPARVTAADNYVHITLPVQVTFGTPLYESYPIKAGLTFKTRVTVAPDWRLKTELYYTGLTDNVADSVKIGPLSLKPKNLIESVIQPLQRLLSPVIDAKVNDAVQLKEKVMPLWQNAFTPRLLSKEFSAWLLLTPDRVVMSPLLAANDRITLSVGIITGAEVTVGPKPAAAPVKPLPPLQQVPAIDKSFHIQLVTNIFFSDLVTALTPVLINKTFGEEKKITIKSFQLTGRDGRLVVVLTASGDFDGELTVLAKPVYNPHSNSLTFEDVDFDTRNTGWLISAGSWLFSSAIRSTIKTRLDAAVVEQLEKARQKASAALAAINVAEHLVLMGRVTTLSLGEAAIQGDRMSVNVIVNGESGVILH
jgi:hypothetical protein